MVKEKKIKRRRMMKMALVGAKKVKRNEKEQRRSSENSLMNLKVRIRVRKKYYLSSVFKNILDGDKPSDEKKSKKSKKKESKFQASWMKRIGEDPDKPLREADAGMEIDESELRTYNDGNPKDSFYFSGK